jgi:hypothetical protein
LIVYRLLGDEVGDDLLSRALADADAISDLADPDGRVERDAQQHVAVVAEKDPTGTGVGWHMRWAL